MAANTLTARREARKRRILENSENRLQRIYGNQDILKDFTKADEHCEQDYVPVINGGLASHGILADVSITATPFSAVHAQRTHTEGVRATAQDEHENQGLLSNTSTFLTSLNEEFLETKPTHGIQKSSTPAEASNISSSSDGFVQARRLRMIFLAVLVNLALSFSYGFLFGEMMLVPFVLLEMTETVLTNNVEPPSPGSGILGIMLLLSGINPQRGTRVASVVNKISNILQNFSIYFFVFTIIYVFASWLA